MTRKVPGERQAAAVWQGPVWARAADVLRERLEQLEARVTAGDEGAWPLYCDAIRTLVAVEARLMPGEHGELLTTRQMAARLGITTKTLLKHRKAGAVNPALRKGKLIRWKGDEVPR